MLSKAIAYLEDRFFNEVSDIVSGFDRLIDRLQKAAERHARAIADKREQCAMLESQIGTHHEEMSRAGRIADRIAELSK